MKKYYLLISILWFSHQGQAQSYIPMLNFTNRWDVLCGGITTNGEDLRQTNILYFEGDTIINDTVYQKLSSIIHYTSTDSVHANIRLLREDTVQKRVYQRYYSATFSPETLLYDFSMNPGDSIITQEFPWGIEAYNKLDSITISTFANAQRHIFHFTCYAKYMGSFHITTSENWIEGIGIQSFDGRIKGPITDYETIVDELLCYWQNGQIQYQNPLYMSCLVIHVGIQEKNKTEIFSIYPNPAGNILSIVLPNEIASPLLVIYSSDGKEIRKEFITGQNHNIDISSLPSGIYLAMLKTENFSIVRKFVKE